MLFVVAFALALVLTPLAGRVATRLGLVDAPASNGNRAGPLKIHIRPIPVLGGAAVVAAALGAVVILGWGPMVWVAAAVAVALGSGIADDARPMPPWVRVHLRSLPVSCSRREDSGSVPTERSASWRSSCATVACANAVNLVDGQDGLAAGLGAIAALALGMLAQGEWRALGLATAGALAGFLNGSCCRRASSSATAARTRSALCSRGLRRRPPRTEACAGSSPPPRASRCSLSSCRRRSRVV